MPRTCSRLRAPWTALLVFAALLPCPAAADQFILKDGRKISGTVVGFQDGMFRVETAFGFALIRKDKVEKILIDSGAAKTPEAEELSAPPESKSPANPKTSPPRSAPAATAASAATPAPAATPSHPLSVPPPARIRERVQGFEYFNETFHFQMYKPPEWRLYEELSREKVSAIVAMSSQDNRTLLFVDRQVWSGPPNLHDDRVEARLRAAYENYRKLTQTPLRVDGLPALRTSFTGFMDGVEWHGVSVRVARDDTVFGIVGLTSAETYGFQEAVFNKIIKTFRFVPATPASNASLGRTP